MTDYSYVLPKSDVLKAIEKLYIDSFPPIERRLFANVEILLEKKDVPFRMIAAMDGSKLLGFLSFWEFDGFRYIEHFAVDESRRGEGIGSALLEYFIKDSDKTPIVLETEIPESSTDARRRVDFYMRHGFILWRLVKYMQPPYDEGVEELEMRLMTLQVNNSASTQRAGEIIRREVYKKIEEY